MSGCWRAPGTLRIATWNVNSLRARMPRVEEWLEYAKPDVVCMQETKITDAAFPTMAFQSLGYETAFHGGGGRWNGVAIASRVGLEGITAGFDDDPEAESRSIGADCGGVRVWSVYVPNGRVIVCGDFNVAPEDRDVYEPAKFVGATHVSDEERKALDRILDWGLVDV